MSVLPQLERYLSAKKEFDDYIADPGEYSIWKQHLYDKTSEAEAEFNAALDQLIADRIESATGARP